MNNGVKAEKENTPNEANLQEEEVLRGSEPAAALPECGRGAGAGPRAPASRGWECPGRWPREGCSCGGCAFVGACLELRNSEGFSETSVSIRLNFVCLRF